MATIKVIRDKEEFAGLRDEWESLLGTRRDTRVFQSFDWNWEVWQRYHGTMRPQESLFILRVTRDGHPNEKAIFPFYLDDHGVLRLIGYMMADVLDCIVPDHADNWHILFADVVSFLREQKEVKGICFDKVEANSELLLYFGTYWPDALIARQETYSYFHTDQGKDVSAQFPHLPSKDRSYLRSLFKKHVGLEYVLFSKEGGSAYPREKILRLRDWMVSQKMRLYDACPDVFIDVMGGLFDVGLCEVACLVDEAGEFSLMSYRLVSGSHINYWLVLYKDGALTTICDVEYIAHKAAAGAFIHDFGIGAYSYKLGTFRPLLGHLYQLKDRPNTLKSLVIDFYWLLRRYVKAVCVRLGILKARR